VLSEVLWRPVCSRTRSWSGCARSSYAHLRRFTPGFLDAFTHAGGKQARSPQLKRKLLAVLIGLATNLGLTRMAEACGISYDTLAWTAEWYVREETLTAANAALVDYHHRLPLAAMFGSGTRTHDGLAAAPARGRTGGQKPKPGPRQLALARAMYDELDDRGKRRYTVAQIAEEFGVTRPTIYRHLDRVPSQAPPPAA
jgi:hypothetical protein